MGILDRFKLDGRVALVTAGSLLAGIIKFPDLTIVEPVFTGEADTFSGGQEGQ